MHALPLIITGIVVAIIAGFVILNVFFKYKIPGFSSGIGAPDGIFSASFGTADERDGRGEIQYNVCINQSAGDLSVDIFEQVINKRDALGDIESHKLKDIVQWSSDSSQVTFNVSRQPIVITIADVGYSPEKIDELRAQS